MEKFVNWELGFALRSEAVRAITLNEFKTFLYHYIERTDTNNIPEFVWDLLDVKERNEINKVWHEYWKFKMRTYKPYCNLTIEEVNALRGIAIKRFDLKEGEEVDEENAIRDLSRNIHILKEFKAIFFC